MNENLKTVVVIPCYNEEQTIGKVVKDFKKELPEAEIFVMNNRSTDKSAELAESAGARVMWVERKGKGSVVREIFRKIDADIYVMADGDDACPAEAVHELMKPVLDGCADMVIGDRHSGGHYREHNVRPFHSFGNSLVSSLVRLCFKSSHDVMSGYRVFNSYIAHNMPILSNEFEVETEMTIYALDRNFNVIDVPYAFRDRPKGSKPKLKTFRDGVKVLKTIFMIIKDYRPLMFFNFFSLIFFVGGIFFGLPVLREFAASGRATLTSSAVLATGLIIISALSFFCGLILDTIVLHHKKQNEIELLHFMANIRKNSNV
ncbi:MAG: glycosyltransferase family 2 protein [Synergistaceae bacterium]|nr:glycosyltransferase family 2 protein [Synergistaceae bacterium]